MKHACDTARGGSERSENTCAACHDEAKVSLHHPIDWTAEWGRQVNGARNSRVNHDATPGARER